MMETWCDEGHQGTEEPPRQTTETAIEDDNDNDDDMDKAIDSDIDDPSLGAHRHGLTQ